MKYVINTDGGKLGIKIGRKLIVPVEALRSMLENAGKGGSEEQ